MLLPAVNAAREAARRATCMNNQSQLALACINYDSAKQNVPPMRGEIGRMTTGSSTASANVVSWVGYILPYMEFNQLYQNLSNVTVTDSSTSGTYYPTQLIRIKSLLCPSADPPDNTNSGTHYVCNGGYQNAVGSDWTSTPTTTWSTSKNLIEPGKASDAVFLDHRAESEDGTRCTTKVSIDYISSHSGTSNVILLSENERPITGGITSGSSGARWAYWYGTATTEGTTTVTYQVMAAAEDQIAFCYPYNKSVTTSAGKLSPDNSTLAECTPSSASSADWSHNGYNNIVNATTDYDVPVFINIGRGREFDTWTKAYHRARPSSMHPGIVLAAFADRSVRPLSESMDKQTFIWICQPNSGRVVSGDAF
jgi:hypothetical protein